MFILSSISSGLEFWSVNHTSIYENSELRVFKNIRIYNFLVKYLIIELKVGDNNDDISFKCNSIFYFIYVYHCWKIASNCLMFLMILSK